MYEKNWEKHLETIDKYCDIKATTADAVYYIDSGCGYCEFRAGEIFDCNSFADFEELCEMFDQEIFLN